MAKIVISVERVASAICGHQPDGQRRRPSDSIGTSGAACVLDEKRLLRERTPRSPGRLGAPTAEKRGESSHGHEGAARVTHRGGCGALWMKHLDYYIECASPHKDPCFGPHVPRSQSVQSYVHNERHFRKFPLVHISLYFCKEARMP